MDAAIDMYDRGSVYGTHGHTVTSAPSMRRRSTLSGEMFSGMHTCALYPRDFAIIASDTPVFPPVPWTIVPPGLSSPLAIA